MRIFWVLLVAAAAVCAQAPSNTPCTLAATDCCVTKIEHAVVSGVSVAYQVCAARTTPSCSLNCACAGACADSSARCSCFSPSSTETPTPSHTPSAPPSVSLSTSPQPTPDATPSADPSPSHVKKSPSPTANATLAATPSPSAHKKKENKSSTAWPVVSAASTAAACLCFAVIIYAGVQGWHVYQRRRRAQAEGIKQLPRDDDDGTELVAVEI